MLVSIAYNVDKGALIHEIDAHRHLHSLISDGLFCNIAHEPVFRRLNDNVVARILIDRRMRDERNVRARILMKPQYLVKVYIIDKAAVCQQNIAR